MATPNLDIQVLRDWWMFALGALIGVVVKVDDLDKDKNSVYKKPNYRIHYQWLSITLGLSLIKGALVFVGSYIVISSKMDSDMLSLVGAGISTMSFDSVWKYIRQRTSNQLNNRRDPGVDPDSLF